MPRTTPKATVLLNLCGAKRGHNHHQRSPATAPIPEAIPASRRKPDMNPENCTTPVEVLSRVLTISTAITSPNADSNRSVTRTGSRTCICWRTGITTVLLVQPKTPPSKTADLQGSHNSERQTIAQKCEHDSAWKVSYPFPEVQFHPALKQDKNQGQRAQDVCEGSELLGVDPMQYRSQSEAHNE